MQSPPKILKRPGLHRQFLSPSKRRSMARVMESPKIQKSRNILLMSSPPSRHLISFRKKNEPRQIVHTHTNTKYNTTASLKSNIRSSPIIHQTFSRNPRHTASNITRRKPLRGLKLRGELGIQSLPVQQSLQFKVNKGSSNTLRNLPLNKTRKALSFTVQNNNSNANSMNTLRRRRGAIIPGQIPVSSMNRSYNTYRPTHGFMQPRRKPLLQPL